MARKTAFESSMHEIGRKLTPELMATGDHTMEGGMWALAKLVSLHDRPTAVVCSNDMTAIGVMREAYEYGIVIPRDLSVVGFDDIRFSSFTIPPLTTVQMSQTLLAEYAFKALIAGVEGKSSSPGGTEWELVTNLVLRGSTAIVPEKQEPADWGDCVDLMQVLERIDVENNNGVANHPSPEDIYEEYNADAQVPTAGPLPVRRSRTKIKQ
jgi:LacI family transcriptional regulator